MRSRWRLTIALCVAAAGAIALSGCFVFVGINWSSFVLKPGDKATATVISHPANKAGEKSYFFFFVGVPDDGSLKLKSATFDTKKTIGHHPKPLHNDPALASLFVSDGNCGDFQTNSSTKYKAFRTDNPVNDHGKVNQAVTSKLHFKQVQLASSSGVNPVEVLVATGFWKDDGDGVPQNSETSCIGGSESGLQLKRAHSKNKAADRAAHRQEAKRYLAG